MEFLSLSDLCKQHCHLWMSVLLFTWICWPIPLSVVSILRSGAAPSCDQPLHLAAQQTYGLCHYAGIVLPIFTFHHESFGSTEWYHSEIRPDIERSSKFTTNVTMKNNVPGECVLLAYHDPNWTFWMVFKLPESLSKGSSVHEVTTGGTEWLTGVFCARMAQHR